MFHRTASAAALATLLLASCTMPAPPVAAVPAGCAASRPLMMRGCWAATTAASSTHVVRTEATAR